MCRWHLACFLKIKLDENETKLSNFKTKLDENETKLSPGKSKRFFLCQLPF
jgi:hypothetical protein